MAATEIWTGLEVGNCLQERIDIASGRDYHDHMVVTTEDIMERRVGIRKLRDELTRHLEQVRRGARITITDRGQPVAMLSPYTQDSQSERAERLRALLSSEHIAPAGKQFLTRPPLVKGRGRLPSDLVSEGRR